MSRSRDLGFAPLTDELREMSAVHFARIASRWILVFTDHEGGEAWRQDLIRAGAEFVRFGIWEKPGATPQFTGDRPAAGHEVIIIAHAARPKGVRMRWNGGGRHAIWRYSIVLNRCGDEPRLHTAQKPRALIENLVRDFSEPGEIIIDPFAGSGTTNVAAKRLGRQALGIEIDPAHAAASQKREEAARYQGDLFSGHNSRPKGAEQIALDLGPALPVGPSECPGAPPPSTSEEA